MCILWQFISVYVAIAWPHLSSATEKMKRLKALWMFLDVFNRHLIILILLGWYSILSVWTIPLPNGELIRFRWWTSPMKSLFAGTADNIIVSHYVNNFGFHELQFSKLFQLCLPEVINLILWFIIYNSDVVLGCMFVYHFFGNGDCFFSSIVTSCYLQ